MNATELNTLRAEVAETVNEFHGLVFGHDDTDRRLELVHSAILASLDPVPPRPETVARYEAERLGLLRNCGFFYLQRFKHERYLAQQNAGTPLAGECPAFRFASKADLKKQILTEVEAHRPQCSVLNVPRFRPDEDQIGYRDEDVIRILAQLHDDNGVHKNEPMAPIWGPGVAPGWPSALHTVWLDQVGSIHAEFDETSPRQDGMAELVARLPDWLARAERWLGDRLAKLAPVERGKPADETPAGAGKNRDPNNPALWSKARLIKDWLPIIRKLSGDEMSHDTFAKRMKDDIYTPHPIREGHRVRLLLASLPAGYDDSK